MKLINVFFNSPELYNFSFLFHQTFLGKSSEDRQQLLEFLDGCGRLPPLEAPNIFDDIVIRAVGPLLENLPPISAIKVLEIIELWAEALFD